MGIAIENNCALEIVDGQFYRIIRSNTSARAHELYKSGSDVVAEQIWQTKEFVPIGLLQQDLRFLGKPRLR